MLYNIYKNVKKVFVENDPKGFKRGFLIGAFCGALAALGHHGDLLGNYVIIILVIAGFIIAYFL
ncbi:MAG: hypothetical protein FWG63_01955 [Defluviitaleaceae bacterium]|nr:hypothetical protein [Defluviitaleaceae bacterium]